MYRNIAGLILLAGVVAGFVVSRNFDYWFTWFHEKVFTNRLWMFDAEKDYMIRMLPEGFFSDMATCPCGFSVQVQLSPEDFYG